MAQERFIVFGKVGSGKSTLCNMLYARHPSPHGGFRTSDGLRGMTSTIDTRYSADYIATDTIGMGEPNDGGGTVSTEEAKRALKAFLKGSRNEYMYIFFVARAPRFSEEDKVYWEVFKDIFKGAENNFVVVYTHTGQKWIAKHKETIKAIYQGQHKFIGVDFMPVAEEDDDLPDEVTRQNMRKIHLDELEKCLRGYSLHPAKPDICFMNEAQLDSYAARILAKMKEVIQRIWAGLSIEKIAKAAGSILGPLLRFIF